MRKIIGAAFAIALSSVSAFAAASHNDSAVLSSDATFQNRVRQSLVSACVTVSTEAVTGLTGSMPLDLHKRRVNFCALVLAAPDSFKTLFADTVAVNATVLNEATQNGTVAITSANVATQAALVLDNDMDAALSLDLNAFLILP